VGLVSNSSDEMFLAARLEAAVVGGPVPCPERCPLAWRPLYELGVPFRPLILRGPLFMLPVPPVGGVPPAGGAVVLPRCNRSPLFIGGTGLHCTAAQTACSRFISEFLLN